MGGGAQQYGITVQIVDISVTPNVTYSSQGTQSAMDGGFNVNMPAPKNGWPKGKKLQVQVLYQGAMLQGGFVNIQIQ